MRDVGAGEGPSGPPPSPFPPSPFPPSPPPHTPIPPPPPAPFLSVRAAHSSLKDLIQIPCLTPPTSHPENLVLRKLKTSLG